MKEDGKDGWGEVDSGEDEESEGVVGEDICPNGACIAKRTERMETGKRNERREKRERKEGLP